jgi:enoyl-CoA hydratase
MCTTITAALLGWRSDPTINAVLIDHEGDRGFCAGGDIRLLAQSGAQRTSEAHDFFYTEYQLNHLLFSYPKSTIAIMDGIVMGGGVGVSMPCRYRVATNKTRFAMPETAIGFFPDVGGGWHLPRLPGRAGYWLGLTGSHAEAGDCLGLGIASHFVETGRTRDLVRALCMESRQSSVDEVLAELSSPIGSGEIIDRLPFINDVFQSGTPTEIVEKLASGDAWARSQAAILAARCPFSVAVTLRHLSDGARAPSFAAVMRRELRIGVRMVQRSDFLEGVRAVVIEKDNKPTWSPKTLRDVPEDLVEKVFEPLAPNEEWQPIA